MAVAIVLAACGDQLGLPPIARCPGVARQVILAFLNAFAPLATLFTFALESLFSPPASPA